MAIRCIYNANKAVREVKKTEDKAKEKQQQQQSKISVENTNDPVLPQSPLLKSTLKKYIWLPQISSQNGWGETHTSQAMQLHISTSASHQPHDH